jgi:glycoprotein endo-alpha-1,2-mannosidase
MIRSPAQNTSRSSLVGIHRCLVCLLLFSIWFMSLFTRISLNHYAPTAATIKNIRLTKHNMQTSPPIRSEEEVVEKEEEKVISQPPKITLQSSNGGKRTTFIPPEHLTEHKPERLSKVHTFYYSWWGTPSGKLEGNRYAHWNHVVLPHWQENVNQQYKQLIGNVHQPPDDLGANFYPDGGPYSSSSPKVIARHMKQIREAGIGVVVLSWYPPGKADSNGKAELADPLTPALLDACEKESLKLAFHIEPYEKRSAQSVWSDAEYISLRYGTHPALARYGPDNLPLLYVYDSYLIQNSDWKSTRQRYSKKNAVYLGLVVEERHLTELRDTRFFDGLYTYFAADGFVWGSSRQNWKYIAQFAKQNNLLASISVGPGYEDTRIRPWNGINTRSRQAGQTYRESFKQASEAGEIDFVSITSWNEWHEGTQIEPAIPKPGYSDYSDLNDSPNAYLILTRQLVDQYFPVSHPDQESVAVDKT